MLAKIQEAGEKWPEKIKAKEEKLRTSISPETQQQEAVATIPAFGIDIDVSHLDKKFRSAAPRIIKKVLKSPEGQAFWDPENRWGGFRTKTGSQEKDILEAIKYFYKYEIHSRSALRKHIRKVMPKMGRKRFSGWRNAVKYYRLHPYRTIKEASLMQKNNDIDSLNKRSINKENIRVTMADNFSNTYFQDAVKGLSDSYSKSYFSGLKSMYNEELGRRDADVGKLYSLHDETGADLVTQSHPKAIVVSDAMGNGGLVENGLEQKQHMEDVARSTPSGNFRSKHAWIFESLVKIANEADQDGFSDASDLIDELLENLSR